MIDGRGGVAVDAASPCTGPWSAAQDVSKTANHWMIFSFVVLLVITY